MKNSLKEFIELKIESKNESASVWHCYQGSKPELLKILSNLAIHVPKKRLSLAIMTGFAVVLLVVVGTFWILKLASVTNMHLHALAAKYTMLVAMNVSGT